MRIYITGANSYLGGHLIPLLEERGYEVIGLDSHGGFVHISKSIPMKDVSIDTCHAVVPLGWYSAVGNKFPELQEESVKRVTGLVEYIASEKLNTHVVFPSSAAVYGNHGDSLVHENSIMFGECDYSRAKLKTEKVIRQRLPERHTIFRFGSLMGVGYPGVRTKRELVVNAFCIDGYTKGKIEVWNHNDWKPVIHVNDAAGLIILAIEASKSLSGVFNASVGSSRAINIANMVARVTGAKVDIIRSDHAPRSCNMDSSKLGTIVNGYSSFRKIQDTIKEFREYVETPNDRNTPWTERELRV